MGKRKNPLCEKARVMYISGVKMVDIAHSLGVPEGTVRRWKSIYKWDSEIRGKGDKLESERSDKKSERSDKHKNEKKDKVDDGTFETLENADLTAEQQLFCIYYSRTFNATQSYLKAYKCSYECANASGPRLLVNVSIQNEIKRLKEIKRNQIMAGEEDIVEMQLRIAFADIGDYLSFGQEKIPGMETPVNVVRLNESDTVDTQLIQEIRQGKTGVTVRLADRQKAVDWLTAYFELNPADRHKREFDIRKMELECLKLNMAEDTEKVEPAQDNFLEMLNKSAVEVWSQEGSMEDG